MQLYLVKEKKSHLSAECQLGKRETRIKTTEYLLQLAIFSFRLGCFLSVAQMAARTLRTFPLLQTDEWAPHFEKVHSHQQQSLTVTTRAFFSFVMGTDDETCCLESVQNFPQNIFQM